MEAFIWENFEQIASLAAEKVKTERAGNPMTTDNQRLRAACEIDPHGEIVGRAKALLDGGISPWPWKAGRIGEYFLQTREGEYLAESMNSWSSPRDLDIRDRDQELAALAPSLADVAIQQAAHIERLEEALRPFVDALEEWGDEPGHEDAWDLWNHPLGMCVTLGDFRKARAALTSTEREGHE